MTEKFKGRQGYSNLPYIFTPYSQNRQCERYPFPIHPNETTLSRRSTWTDWQTNGKTNRHIWQTKGDSVSRCRQELRYGCYRRHCHHRRCCCCLFCCLMFLNVSSFVLPPFGSWASKYGPDQTTWHVFVRLCRFMPVPANSPPNARQTWDLWLDCLSFRPFTAFFSLPEKMLLQQEQQQW